MSKKKLIFKRAGSPTWNLMNWSVLLLMIKGKRNVIYTGVEVRNSKLSGHKNCAESLGGLL